MDRRIDQEERPAPHGPEGEADGKLDGKFEWMEELGLEFLWVGANSIVQPLEPENSTHLEVSVHHFLPPIRKGWGTLQNGVVSQACAKEMVNLALRVQSEEIQVRAMGTWAIAQTVST